jgi:hypothetical protein
VIANIQAPSGLEVLLTARASLPRADLLAAVL